MSYKAPISKEATLQEVLSHVTLVDVGRMMRTVAISLASFGVLALIAYAGTSLASPLLEGWFVGWHWPMSLTVFFFALLFCAQFGERSFHAFNLSFWFPKLGCLGIIVGALYIAGGFYLLRHVAWWTCYITLTPIILAIDLFQLGHGRLMTEREKI